jgi:hypothetical protein
MRESKGEGEVRRDLHMRIAEVFKVGYYGDDDDWDGYGYRGRKYRRHHYFRRHFRHGRRHHYGRYW